MAISVKLGERKVWKVNVGVASTDTRDHTKLENRDAADQHPINSISGLEKALSQKAAAQDLKGHVDNKQNPHGLTAEQVGARPSDWMPTAEQVGARPDNWMPSASEVGARPNTWLPTPEQIGAAPALDWSHLKWYVMGDSLTAQDNAFTDKRYYDFVQEKTGIQVIVDGVGATGYKAGEDEGQSFLDRVKNIPEDVDIITIFGSGNDLTSTDTTYANAAIYDTLAWILLNRCGLRVIVVPPTPWRNYDKRGEVWKAYCDRLQVCALACDFRYLSEVYDCPPFNGKYDSHVEKFFTNDPNGVHPNEEGHKALAPYFYNALLQELALDKGVGNPQGGSSGQNINPVAKTEDMTQPVGVDADGRLWVAPIGGGNTGTTTHGIVWDLVNVTTSNAVTSVSDGASLFAVLTAADGYTLGDVTVTMGGEALTGVWNADTATLTIASVTGDVIISCAGTVISEEVLSNFLWRVSGWPARTDNGDGSQTMDWGALSDDPQAGTPYWTVIGPGQIAGGQLAIKFNKTITSGGIQVVVYAVNADATIGYYITLNGFEWTNEFVKGNTTSVSSDVTVNIPDGLYPRILVRNGQLIMDGDTGYSNLNTATHIANGDITFTVINNIVTESTALCFDDDVAQNYAVATASILGEETATNTSSAYGISTELATVIDEVRTAWMLEYGGDYRKIPLIITTDQHGRTNSGIFNMLGKTLSLHDVSKICNLGDTVADVWSDKDTTNPLISCTQLENWCESVKAIPFSKRLDVYGNHDTWYGNYQDEGNPIGTRYPSSQAYLNQYFRNVYARRTNNNGWFAVHDDQFNVKYVVISGFEYQNSSAFRIGTAQMKFIIDEFNKNDGYDIVVVSHVPLWQVPASNVFPTGQESESALGTELYSVAAISTVDLFNARKSKTGGTVTDSDGVTHNFDFSNCTTDILCGLHGHMHYDAYNYVGGVDNGLMNMSFDWFDDNVIHFVLVDRINRQLNVWKVEGDALTYTNYQVPFDKVVE